MRQASTEKIALVIDEYLCFVFKQPKGVAMDNAIPIPLELAASRRRRFRMPAASCMFGMASIGRKYRHGSRLHLRYGGLFQHVPQGVRRCGLEPRLPDFRQEHETQFTAFSFLVDLHQLDP